VVQLAALWACLQDLFGPVAYFLARRVGLIGRRVLTGTAAASALVFRRIADSRATLEDIALGLRAKCPGNVPGSRIGQWGNNNTRRNLLSRRALCPAGDLGFEPTSGV
jgi:hypothetical protein